MTIISKSTRDRNKHLTRSAIQCTESKILKRTVLLITGPSTQNYTSLLVFTNLPFLGERVFITSDS